MKNVGIQMKRLMLPVFIASGFLVVCSGSALAMDNHSSSLPAYTNHVVASVHYDTKYTMSTPNQIHITVVRNFQPTEDIPSAIRYSENYPTAGQWSGVLKRTDIQQKPDYSSITFTGTITRASN